MVRYFSFYNNVSRELRQKENQDALLYSSSLHFRKKASVQVVIDKNNLTFILISPKLKNYKIILSAFRWRPLKISGQEKIHSHRKKIAFPISESR